MRLGNRVSPGVDAGHGRLAVPVFDNHFHLDPKGRGVEAVKEFARAGGTALMLVHKPYREHERPNTTLDEFRDDYETTVRLANLRSGGLDLLERLNATDMASVKGDSKVKLNELPDLSY